MITREELQASLHLNDAGAKIYDLIEELNLRITTLEKIVNKLQEESGIAEVDENCNVTIV